MVPARTAPEASAARLAARGECCASCAYTPCPPHRPPRPHRRPGRRARLLRLDIEVLEPDHPERRFVAALCLYSHAVDTGEAGRTRYEQSEAERFARALLVPGDALAAIADRPDVELAEVFGVPLDHVALRRRDCSSR